MTVFADLADSNEDARIDKIGKAAMSGLTVAFVTDAKPPAKVERYKKKLLHRFPGIRILEQFDGPIANCVSVKVGPPKGAEQP
jgi:hypothetical protein